MLAKDAERMKNGDSALDKNEVITILEIKISTLGIKSRP